MIFADFFFFFYKEKDIILELMDYIYKSFNYILTYLSIKKKRLLLYKYLPLRTVNIKWATIFLRSQNV